MLADVLSANDTKNRTIILVVTLLALALGIRLAAFGRLHLIARDGITYISLAQRFLSGGFHEAFSHPYHPLYPLLVALTGTLVDNLERGGRLVSLTLGSLTVVPLFFFAKAIAGTGAAFIAGLFYVFQPYSVRFSVDVLSDSPFIFFFLTALCLGVKGSLSERRGACWGLGAGMGAGLAYLTRPEGILAVFFPMAWYGIQWWRAPKRRLSELLTSSSALVIAFLLVALPYLLFVRTEVGSWQLTMKPSLKKSVANLPMRSTLQSADRPNPPAAAGQEAIQPMTGPLAPSKAKSWARDPSFWQIVMFPTQKFVETYPYFLFPFFIFGSWVLARRGLDSLGAALAVFVLVYLAALCYLFDSVGYVSRRHLLPLICISLPAAGAGFWELERRIAAWMERQQGRWSLLPIRHIAIIMLLLVAAPLGVKALQSQGEDKIPLREAGILIKTKAGSGTPTVMSNEPLTAYYAQGKHVSIPAVPYRALVTLAGKEGVDYLVFGPRDLEQGKQFINRLRPIHFQRVPFECEEVQIYRVVRPERKS